MRFSVVIPVYNKASTIKASIESVLSQSMKDFEIVVVDDGSTDNLDEVLSAYPDIKVIHQKNGGVSVARNTGIDASEGEFVCFLDADDLWLENHLSELSFRIDENPEINYFITSHKTVNSDGGSYNSSVRLSDFDGEYVITDNLFRLLNRHGDGIIHTNCICARKESLVKHGLKFEPGVRIGEDTDMWYRIALKESLLLSKTVTTVYQREYSTATQSTMNSQDWVFAGRLHEILASETISEGVKKECAFLVDRYMLTCARELKCQGKSKDARSKLKSVMHRSGRRYWLTLILCCMPTVLCRKILGVKGK